MKYLMVFQNNNIFKIKAYLRKLNFIAEFLLFSEIYKHIYLISVKLNFWLQKLYFFKLFIYFQALKMLVSRFLVV